MSTSWTRVKLGEILDEPLRNGVSPSTDGDVEARVLTLSAITGTSFDASANKVGRFKRSPPSHYRVNSSDLLICRGNGNLALVGRGFFPSEDRVDLVFPDTVIAARVSRAKANQSYVQYLWNSSLVRVQIESRARTTNGTFKINQEILHEIVMPLPSLAEQAVIAARLEGLDRLRALRVQALYALDELLQSTFVAMFGDPVGDKISWARGVVGSFVWRYETGKNLVADDADNPDSKYRVLKVSAVTSLVFDPKESKALPEGYEPPSSHFVREGDLLFSRANTEALIGATALVGETSQSLALPDKLWRFVWYEPQRAEVLYVRQLFQQASFRREIARRSSGTSGSMKNISQSKVLSIPVGLPPLELQREFARRVVAVEELKAKQQAQLQQLDKLFAALQDKAF
jgi:type I restriction enzyme S subunit